MMEIIEIRYLTKKKAKILFEGGSSLVLYTGEIKKLGWTEGGQIERNEYETVRTETVEKRAKLYAMHLLQDQDRTEKELLDRLKRAEYDPDIAHAALAYVKRFGYVDDERYASNYVERNSGVRSRRQIIQELTRKGIDADTIEDAFAQNADEEDEYRAVFRLLRKRRYTPPGEEDDPRAAAKERDRQLRYLASKGFSYASARHVLDHWDEYE